jgi:hypothetical protein
MQTRINLPDRWLFDEKMCYRAQRQMAQDEHRMHYVINLLPDRLALTWASQVQPEHYITVTAIRHEFMFALHERMLERLLYCAYCGTWRTLCNAHEESTPLFTSDLHLPKLLTTDRKPYVCLTRHTKGASRLHQAEPANNIPLFEECLGRSDRPRGLRRAMRKAVEGLNTIETKAKEMEQ